MKRKDLYEQWEADGDDKANLSVIQSMAMQGASNTQIAEAIGISERQFYTLKNRHSAVSSALKKRKEVVVALAQNKLLERVQSGDTTAIIYALKVYGGDFFKKDRDTIKAEISGRDGKPVEFQQTQVHVYLPEKEELE